MSDPGRRPAQFDPGLQPERTALAWRRTTLALVVGCLVGIRILGQVLGPVATLPVGAGLLVAIALAVGAHLRGRRVDDALLGDGATLPDGWMVAMAAACTLMCGLAAVLFLLR